jgi:hypothetical protein
LCFLRNGRGIWFGQPVLGKQLTIQRPSQCSATCLSEPSQRFRMHSGPKNANPDWRQASFRLPPGASETPLNSTRWHWAPGLGSRALADRRLPPRRLPGADQFELYGLAESRQDVEMRASATLDPYKLSPRRGAGQVAFLGEAEPRAARPGSRTPARCE